MQGGQRQHPVSGANLIAAIDVVTGVERSPVRNDYAFRRAGRTGGVDNVGRLRGGACHRVGDRLRLNGLLPGQDGYRV